MWCYLGSKQSFVVHRPVRTQTITRRPLRRRVGAGADVRSRDGIRLSVLGRVDSRKSGWAKAVRLAMQQTSRGMAEGASGLARGREGP